MDLKRNFLKLNYMRKNKLIHSLFFFLFCISASAQDEKVAIVILKGGAIIESSNKQIELNKSDRLTLPKNALIKIYPNSAIIAYNNKANIEIGGAKEQKLTYVQISNSLNKIKSGSLSSNFLIYLDKLYADVEKKNNSFGASVGAASRGIKEEIPLYSPNDETIILADTLLLTFGSRDTKLFSNLKVTNQSLKEQVFNERTLSNSIILTDLKSGSYIWEYTIESYDKKRYDFKNSFLVLDSIDKQAKLKEIAEFKSFLNFNENSLSEENKKILFKDFLEKNKFYFK